MKSWKTTLCGLLVAVLQSSKQVVSQEYHGTFDAAAGLIIALGLLLAQDHRIGGKDAS